MFSEDDLLPLSGLQHLMFCERQWGLIHIEQLWEENRLTAEGRVLHERAHQAGTENRPHVRTSRGLRLHSLRLGLAGQADVVEFHRSPDGVALPELEGLWRPFPVEYKRGRPKRNACDEVQLCAQALCLEEMFGRDISEGALYYGEPRRRTQVAFSGQLRARTEALAARMHELYRAGATPLAAYEPKCDGCSLMARCLPRLLAKPPGVARYLARALAVGED
jgi:CRISPR-associated exonuclease Cas4